MLDRCPRCGAETRLGARFCFQCGAALAADATINAAPANERGEHAVSAPTLVGVSRNAPEPSVASLSPHLAPYQPPTYAPFAPRQAPQRSGMAMAGFCVGLATVVVGIFLTWLGTIMGICGLIFSLIGLAETGPHALDRGQPRTGRGLAIAGVILAIIGIIGSVLLLIYILQHAAQFGIQLPPSLRP